MESTIEPCKVRTLVVPVGTWKKDAYLAAVDELERHGEIRLVDVTPLPDCTFNPQLFPHGRVLYSFLTREHDSNSMMFLHDFEPYRKLFVVIGLCNDGLISTEACVNELRERYGSAISYAVIYNDRSKVVEQSTKYGFSRSEEPLETIMCDITRNFLESLHVYYSSYKHVTLRSPGAIGGPSVLKTTLTKKSQTTAPITNPRSKKGSSLSSKDDSSSSSLSISDDSIKDKSKRYSSLNALSGGTSDKSMQRSKARQLKLLANLQLLAGQYLLSMNNFAEAARILHKIHDYIWLGSSLEGILTCIILISYLQLPFQVPPIIHSLCSLSQNSNSILSPTTSRRSSMQSVASPRNSVSTITAASLDHTNIDIPKLVKKIADKALYYYDYSLSYSVEFTPQVVYCKSILRTLTFMSLCYKANGFDQRALQEMIFSDMSSSAVQNQDSLQDECIFTKSEIYQYSTKIFELQLKSMDLSSQIQIYLTLCMVYDNLNMFRKKSFVLRILFISILSQLTNDYLSENYHSLIDDLMKNYRISGWEPEHKLQDASSYNWVTLQKNVLMLIIKISAHFKNYKNVVEHSQLLLKRFSHTLTKLEQIDLLNQYILPHQNEYPVEYMDPFLIRDICFSRTRSEEMPMLKVLRDEESRTFNDPHQIFNPFASVHHKTKENETENSNYFLVAETVQMVITFQNPFKFDVRINSINFTEDDAQFMKIADLDLTSCTIPASSKKQFCVGVTFVRSTLTLHQLKGLSVSVLGLPSKFWGICKQPGKFNTQERCTLYSVPITIIDQQPTLCFLSTTLVDNRVMLLDGTETEFKVFLRNSSLSSPINYCSVSWIANVETELKENYWTSLAPDDLYDVDSQLKWLRENFISISSIPNEVGINESFHFSVNLDVTKAPFTLKWARITIQYGYKKSPEDLAVYVKSLTIPIEITLQRVLEVSNVNFIPIPEAFEAASDIGWIKYLRSHQSVQSDYVLMLIDMRNSWLLPVSFSFHYDEYVSERESLDSNETRRFVVPIRKIANYDDSPNFKDKLIPRIDESKQYLTSGLTLTQENEMREKFWCREHILNRLKCTWDTALNEHTEGSVEFRQFVEKLDKQVNSLVYPPSNVFDIKVSASETTVKVGTPVRLNVTVNTTLHTDLVPIRYYILDYFTGKSVLSDHPKSIVFQGQTSTLVRPRITTEFNILPLKKAKFQIEIEVPGNILTREPIIITAG